jgi:hypothetical protein
MREGVQAYVDDVLKTKEKLDKTAILQIEHRVTMPAIHKDNWGTLDAVIYHRSAATIYLWDFKWGHGFVEVFENWQEIDYLAGVLNELGDDKPDYDVVFRIAQPRSYHKDGSIREWRVKASDLSERFRHLNAKAHEALSNDPTAEVGEHCKHCEGRRACKALQAAALDAVDRSTDATPFDLPPSALGRELAVLHRAIKLMESRVSGLEAQALAEIRGGKPVPGWGIEHSQGREFWNKPEAEILAIGEMFGVRLDKGVALITPNAARKLGVDPSVVELYASRNTGAAKLVQIDTTDARKAFGG